jgi:hypothetical protein
MDDSPLIASPLCCYESPCRRQGRARLGPVERVSADCENQTITCVTCGAIGIKSRNLAVQRKAAPHASPSAD